MDPQTPRIAPAQSPANSKPTVASGRKIHRETLALPPALAERFALEPQKTVREQPSSTGNSLGAKHP